MGETLRGREVVLAGGAGGLGSALADLLAEEGARLVIGYRSGGARAASWENRARVVQADIAQSEARGRLLDAAPSLYGLVVLTGDPARVRDSSELEAAMRLSHEANYLGPVLLAREAAARMHAQGTQGAIVLVSTMQAVSVFPGSTAYAAQKAALIHAAKVLAKEMRGKGGVRINVVCPGVNAAGMAEASIAAGKYDRYIEDGIIDRFGRAIDVARAIRLFLEPDNYITGQVLTVDGGLTL